MTPAASGVLHSRYRVQDKLGDALYGAVWLCEDLRQNSSAPTKTAPLVAIKQVSLRKARQALLLNSNMDNPWDERRITAKLMRLGPHSNILQYRHEFMEGGSWFMVMDQCDGGDVLDMLHCSPDNRFPEAHALELFAHITQGVRFMHANGFAHRDLSLENVLLQGNTPKLCDFGLSTETDRLCTERVGKAYYMAPEVIAQEAYDPAASDMWSLGIMLFVMLTGSPLTPSASPEEKGFQALMEFGVRKILEVWGLESEVSPAVVELLEALLQVNPAKRFTIEDVVLHAALTQQRPH
ncbi:Serine/threonine protein kinase [Globisporangium polare]